MSTYGLLEHFADTEDTELLKMHKALNDGSNYVATDIFKDKRLNKLWAKAEMAGFTGMQYKKNWTFRIFVSWITITNYTCLLYILGEELDALKQEFHHHQEKVDEYMSLLKDPQPEDSKSES